SGYSALMTAQGAGAVAGAFLVAGASFRRGAEQSSIRSMLVFALALGTFAISRSFPLTMAAAFLAGLSLLGVVTTVSSLVQLATPEAMRGRVMSIFMLAFRGGMPLGNLASGWVAEHFGVAIALGLNAGSLALFGISFWVLRNRAAET
ncbi:MAG TPA: MFS transporter, partial [Thermoanaerobaculia bacterium]|nr:MFS transporter [Thermoanaerobaculia bacterium]